MSKLVPDLVGKRVKVVPSHYALPNALGTVVSRSEGIADYFSVMMDKSKMAFIIKASDLIEINEPGDNQPEN